MPTPRRVRKPQPARAPRPRADKLSAALFHIADAASAARDLPAFYAELHRIVGELMYAKNFIIGVYDAMTDRLSYPYIRDEAGLPASDPPIPVSKRRKGFAIHVLKSGATLHASRAKQKVMIADHTVKMIGALAEDWVGVPLKAEGETLGVLVVQSYTQGMRYTAQDVQLLEFVAQHIAIALTRARALEETRQRVAELQIINRVQHALASQLDLQAIYDLVGDTIRDIFDLQAVMICTFDLAHELEIFHYNYEQGRRYYPAPRQYDATRKKLIASREPILINRVTPEFLAQVGGRTIEGTPIPKAGIFAPLIVRQEIQGYVSIQNLERFDAFSDADVRLLQTLANAMSGALENARLFDELQTRHREITEALEQQTATSEILRVIASSPTEIQPVLDVIVENARRLCNASMATVYRSDGTMVYEVASTDISGDILETERAVARDAYPAPLNWNSTLSSRAILGRALVHIPDMEHAPDLPAITRRYVQAKILNSVLHVPLMREGEAIGCIGLGKRDPAPFTDKQIALMQTFADQAVIAIENVRLFNETKRLLSETEQRAAELAIINSVQQGLASKLEMQAIYDLVGEKIREIFDAQAVMMVTFDYATERGHITYMWEKGARFYPPPSPFTPFIRHIIRTRQVVLFKDDFQRRAQEFGMHLIAGDWSKSAVYVPLIVGEVATGLISLHNMDRENAFGESDVRLLETLANAMSVALENARLFDQVQTRNREITEALEQQTATSEILRVIASSPTDVQPVMDVIAANAVRLAGADDAAIARVEGDVLRVVAHHGIIPFFAVGQGVAFNRDTVAGRAILDRVTIQVANLIDDAEYPLGAQVAREYGYRTILCVPLLREDAALGVITIRRIEERPFDAQQIALLQTFADQAVIAIENVRLFNETKRLLSETEQRAAELAIINSVQQGLASKLEMQAIYDLVGEKIREIFHAHGTAIYLFEPEQDLQHTPYCFLKQRFVIDAHPLSDLAKLMLRTRQSRIYHNVDEYRALGGKVLETGEEFKSGMNVPLTMGQEIRGMIHIASLDKTNGYNESDLRLLQTLVNSMSVALENARLFAETNQRAAELAIINDVGTALAQQLDLQRVIELVGEKIRDVFDAQAVGIALHDPKHRQILYPYTWNRGRKLDLPPGKIGGLSGHAIKTRQTLVINRDFAQRATEYRSRLMVGPDYPQAGVYVPILIGENVLGTLTLLNYERENVFADSDVRLIETIAANMGVAIQNARLFEELQVSLTTTTRLSELSAQMLSATSVEETARFITRALQQAFAADVVSLNLLEANGQFRYWDSAGLPDEFYQRGQPRPEGITRRAMDLAEPLIIQTPELLSPATRALDVQSTIALPLRDEKSSLGVLFLNYRATREFDQREIDALSLFANQTALAVKRLRLIEETQQRAAELAIINGMGDALAGQIELDALIQLVGAKLRATFRADIVYIALLDRATNLIHFPYYNEQGHTRTEPPLAFGQGLTSKIIETRQPLLMNQDLEKKRSELGVARQGTPARAYLGVPILVGDEAIGVISVQSTAHENRFGDAEQRLLTTIAAGVGVAIERARLYQTTQNQKQYFEALVQNSPVAIVTIDLDTRVTEWNPAAERLFGYTRAETLGKSIDDLVARDESVHAEATGYSQRGITQGGIFHAITKRQRKDGSLVDVDMWGVPIFVGAQRVGVYAMYVDITELEHARREAIAANDAKSAFLATMSHEIRTPMNAIIGMSGLLLNTDLTRDQREFAEIVRNSGEGLLAIINDILDFSKIEAAKMELERAPFDLRDALESSLDLVAATAAEKGLDLACVIEDGVPAAIIGDVTRLRQILLNLLNNAVKFTEQGEVVLEVKDEGRRMKDEEKPSAFILHPSSLILHFTVRDTGIGIPPDRIDRLFQSFTQVDASTTRKYGGTGLGLAISKRLVELMGGAMWVESASGVGTTFHFTLPIQVAPEFTPRVRAPRDHSRLTGKRVLIVDDNATNRRILVLQTRGWGMSARDTASPREALEWIQNDEPFDLAILDMQMPELDGLQLARAIRAHRDARALPLVMFSSLGQRNDETDALGFVAFLKKPLKQSQLLDALIGIFGAPASAPPPSVAPHLDAEMATRIPLRILLAEDNAVNQKLALRLLSQLGYRADVAANGVETLQAVERQQYDVVLMDVQMPEMDGLEATRAIRRGVTPPQHQPRIIAMTANAMQGDREMCLAAGMDDYISKPIRVDELIRALSESRVTS